MKRWISFPKIEGVSSRQAHTDLPEGTYERELGRDGFYGPVTHMYHRHPPTGWSGWEGPLRPRAFDLRKITARTPCPWDAQLLLHNAHLRYRIWRTSGHMQTLARNADGDELIFVHEGAGDFYCDFGRLAICEGDYVMVPRGTMWRTEFAGPATCLLIEATNEGYGLPDKGMLGQQAIFDPAVLDTPKIDEQFAAQQTDHPWSVRIKRHNRVSTVTYPYNPLDAVGWHGNLAVVRLNVRDIRPVMSHRYHLPPSVHTTFVADRFVVCSFCPRPLESDPGALKVPFFHNNDDFDEVIFYHKGDFFSRDNIAPGMLTFHPSGFPHGPHPKALEGALKPGRTATDEYAVMVDARDGLEVAPLPAGVEDPSYVDSWKASR